MQTIYSKYANTETRTQIVSNLALASTALSKQRMIQCDCLSESQYTGLPNSSHSADTKLWWGLKHNQKMLIVIRFIYLTFSNNKLQKYRFVTVHQILLIWIWTCRYVACSSSVLDYKRFPGRSMSQTGLASGWIPFNCFSFLVLFNRVRCHTVMIYWCKRKVIVNVVVINDAFPIMANKNVCQGGRTVVQRWKKINAKPGWLNFFGIAFLHFLQQIIIRSLTGQNKNNCIFGDIFSFCRVKWDDWYHMVI